MSYSVILELKVSKVAIGADGFGKTSPISGGLEFDIAFSTKSSLSLLLSVLEIYFIQGRRTVEILRRV